jgi:hypothetical protein
MTAGTIVGSSAIATGLGIQACWLCGQPAESVEKRTTSPLDLQAKSLCYATSAIRWRSR